MQAPILGSFVVSLLFVYLSPFCFAYDAQYCQGWGSCKGTCAQVLVDICRYTCVEVKSGTAPHRDYITTIIGVLSRVQWDTASFLH